MTHMDGMALLDREGGNGISEDFAPSRPRLGDPPIVVRPELDSLVHATTLQMAAMKRLHPCIGIGIAPQIEIAGVRFITNETYLLYFFRHSTQRSVPRARWSSFTTRTS